MKTAGIIGGMGPEATLDFLSKVITLTSAQKDQEHIKMIIYMNPEIPDRSAAIINKEQSPEPELLKSARLLQKANVDLIAIPCVTAHHWIEKIQHTVSIPVLNIIQVALEYIKHALDIKNIGILATDGTLRAHLFEKYFEPAGYRIITPNNTLQTKAVMKSIYDIKTGNPSPETKNTLLNICQHLIAKKAEVIIAACTEIPLVINQQDLNIPFVDINLILAQKVVEQIRAC